MFPTVLAIFTESAIKEVRVRIYVNTHFNTVEPGYKRTGYKRNLVIRDENAVTKIFYIIKPGYRRNWL